MKLFHILSAPVVDQLMQLKRAAQGSTVPQTVGGQVEATKKSKAPRVGGRKASNKGVVITPEMRKAALQRGVVLSLTVSGEIREIVLPVRAENSPVEKAMSFREKNTKLGLAHRARVLARVSAVEALMEVVSSMLKSLRNRPSGLDKNGVRFV